jgi:hypothetical protein
MDALVTLSLGPHKPDPRGCENPTAGRSVSMRAINGIRLMPVPIAAACATSRCCRDTKKRMGNIRDRESPSRAANNGIPMKINIDKLSESELIDLNHRIVARLRFLNEMRAHHEMLEFKIGDRVVFKPPGQGPVEGMLTRYNKKTVTVITDDGRQWNVSPCFLSKPGPSRETKLIDTNIVLLGKR